MKKIITALTLWAALFAFWFPVRAQQPKKIPRIGYFAAQASSAELPRIDAFRQGLRALGYVEGQNIVIDYRFTDGKLERLPEVAAELVRLKVDVLIAISTNAAVAAKRATSTIPILFMGVSGPIEAGLVGSLARPGGNITGLTNIASVLSGKRLEFLKEILPKLSRVAVLWDPHNPGSSLQWKESEIAAKELSLPIFSMDVSRADKYESAFHEAIRARIHCRRRDAEPVSGFKSKTGRRPGRKKSAAGDIRSGRFCEQRWSYVLRLELCGRRP